MAYRKPQISIVSGTGRGWSRIPFAVLVAWATGLAVVPAASAIEIFGIKLFESDDEAEDIADPLAYTVTFEVTGEAEMRERLEKASALVQDAERPVSGSVGLLGKARGDRERLVGALYEEARYDGVVEVVLDGRPLDTLPPDAEFGAGPVSVLVRIDPGPVFTLGEVALKGHAAGLAPAEFGLIPGGDARSGEIIEAEGRIVRRLKEEGRPLAAIGSREVVADSATAKLDVSITVAAGPVAGYGDTSVTGTVTMDREFTEYVADLKPGRTYSPKDIDDARDRLLGLGVFSSVTVKEAGALDAAGNIPVEVEVSERKLRYYGVGATISNVDGLGAEGYWGHRNLFGRAESLRVEGSVGGIGARSDFGKLNYNAAIMFEKPGVVLPDSKFFASARTVYDHPDAFDRFSAEAGVGISYQFTRQQSASIELTLDYSDIDDVFHPEGVRHLLVSVPFQYVLDKRDDRLDPKSGFRAVAFAEPSYDLLDGATFVKLRGDGSVYQALDEAGRFVVAGRVATGSILGAGLAAVPADRRFYSGGGGSVRGYAYQGIGPKGINGKPTGGRSFAETSVELRFRLNDKLGIVPFIDAGVVSEDAFPDFGDGKVGAGIGVRYLTPFGPLRVDAAVPLNPDPGDPDFGIYAGVGQAF